ncbi:MAG: hypothetical protein M3115_05560 [Thermoproteota archaeon]|nr:hypothetical protein [Thermoproteota archaeon]
MYAGYGGIFIMSANFWAENS